MLRMAKQLTLEPTGSLTLRSTTSPELVIPGPLLSKKKMSKTHYYIAVLGYKSLNTTPMQNVVPGTGCFTRKNVTCGTGLK